MIVQLLMYTAATVALSVTSAVCARQATYAAYPAYGIPRRGKLAIILKMGSWLSGLTFVGLAVKIMFGHYPPELWVVVLVSFVAWIRAMWNIRADVSTYRYQDRV